jgi:hypothetical protein
VEADDGGENDNDDEDDEWDWALEDS